jgi:hypothetical protein
MYSIPKEAPWKTSVLNKQFRKKRNREFSTATSGTERKRGFVGIEYIPVRTFIQNVSHILSFTLPLNIIQPHQNQNNLISPNKSHTQNYTVPLSIFVHPLHL